MTSFTVSLSSNQSILSANFFPELVLDSNYEYMCALLDFNTYQSIHNVTKTNNKLHFNLGNYNFDYVEVPVGCYEANEVLEYINTALTEKGISFEYKINKRTLKITIKCSVRLVFWGAHSIHGLFGFNDDRDIPANQEVTSDHVVKITNLNVIRLNCNIISGSYINGKLGHSLYEFAANKVEHGYRIIEQPTNIIYLPVVPKRINYIEITVTDQNGDLIDFRGEEVTCRIHIKRV